LRGSRILYTDGLTDVSNEKQEMFGEDKLYEYLQQKKELSPEDLINDLFAHLSSYQGDSEQMDDMTIIALKKL